jgi:hypothetical protein
MSIKFNKTAEEYTSGRPINPNGTLGADYIRATSNVYNGRDSNVQSGGLGGEGKRSRKSRNLFLRQKTNKDYELEDIS